MKYQGLFLLTLHFLVYVHFMKKTWLILFACLLALGSILAQKPFTWSFTVKKMADKTYEIHCLADIDLPWHIYSQFTPDGGPTPTKFEFSKNPLYTLDGGVKENGMLTVKHEPVFGVNVKYFWGAVDFVQRVKLKGNARTNISGSVEFMVCDDTQCLSPVTEKFTLALN